MARPNLYGASPIASAQRRGGGGGGGNRPRRPNNNRGGGGGGGGGSGSPTEGGLYEGDQGEAAANQDPLAYFSSLLAGAGQSDYTGTPYGEYANKTRLDELMRQYGLAQAGNQGLSPEDFAMNQYGAGWTETTAQGEKRRHGKGRRPGETTSVFSAGNLPQTTVDSYTDWFSNMDPRSYLRTNATAGGGRIEGGGNTDFQQWYDESFIPGVQSQLEAARAKGYTPLVSTPGTTTTGNAWRLGDYDNVGPSGAGWQLGDYDNRPITTIGGTTAGVPVGANPKLSLDDFIQGRNLVNEAQQSYAFRPNARRLPGPLNLSGRWSWWS